jgi:hypothetical protein
VGGQDQGRPPLAWVRPPGRDHHKLDIRWRQRNGPVALGRFKQERGDLLPRSTAVAVADRQHVADDILQLVHALAIQRHDRRCEPSRSAGRVAHCGTAARWPIVTEVAPFAEAERVHDRVAHGEVIGRAVLRIA